ncbi:MAG: 16S rRNA (cytosine(1402)-N(4))-methyltransferase RsmH [Patescibacteria group bacterium]
MIHKPVLWREVIRSLQLESGMKVIDGTVGAGGHAAEILAKIIPDGRLLAIDRDESIVELAKKKLVEYGDNIVWRVGSLANLKTLAGESGFGQVDAILFDLGLSSWQLDDRQRGFSYLYPEAKLDMRMGAGNLTASDVLNTYDLDELARILKNHADIKRARFLAKRIISSRRAKPFRQVEDLVALVKNWSAGGVDSRRLLARVWQAIRMEVNQELIEIESGIKAAIELLVPGGVLAVICFHSVEDRMVKNLFRQYSQKCICPKEFPQCVCQQKSELKIITKKPIVPSVSELAENIRSHSAKLRVVVKNKE